MIQSLIWAALGTGFAFLMTVSGAATVFLFRKQVNEGLQKIFLGFASGIMIAASIWSLIIPAIEQAEASGGLPWVPAALGFLFGGLFLLIVDVIFAKCTNRSNRSNLLVFAVTLHNIPEGMAVGLAFALAAQNIDQGELYAAAFALALGIGVQNFPEGAAVSLPLRQESVSLRGFICSRRTDVWDDGSAGVRLYPAGHALAFVLCGRSHDLCRCGRIDSRSQ